MKRREFLRTVGATAAMTTLPVTGTSAAALHRTRYGMSPYVWAKYTARINKKLTPQMLKSYLGFSEGEAHRMIRRLTFENVLAAPDAKGVSRTSSDYISAVQKRRDTMKRMIQKVREELAETASETEDAPDHSEAPSDQADTQTPPT